MSKTKIKVSLSDNAVRENGTNQLNDSNIPSEPPISRYGVGFDVHKNKISTCVAAQLTTGDIIVVKEHVFRANPTGITDITRFLQKYTPVSCYLMECTGVYHLPLFFSLKAAFPEAHEKIIAMNPLLLNRRITELGKKTDKADAKSLAMLTFYTSLLKPSYVGNHTFVRMRDLIRSYHKSKKQCTRFKNRITRVLHSVNIKDVFDLSKEWALKLLDFYASQSWTLGEAYDQLIMDLKASGSAYKVLEKQQFNIISYRDVILSEGDRFIILMEVSRLFQEQIVAISYLRTAEKYILQDLELLKHYKALSVIPGMGAVSAITILLELGDYSRFNDAKAFSKFCGTAPLIYESGEHKTRGSINRFSNPYLRNALTATARILINKCKKDSDLAIYAHKQYHVKQMPFKKAVIKVANKLAKTVYYILLENIQYDPFYETRQRDIKQYEHKLQKKQTLLPSASTRVLRRNINDFIAMNFEYMNSSSRFMLCNGFHKMLKRAKEIHKKETNKGSKKKSDNL